MVLADVAIAVAVAATTTAAATTAAVKPPYLLRRMHPKDASFLFMLQKPWGSIVQTKILSDIVCGKKYLL